MANTLNARYTVYTGTAAQWATTSVILLKGEIGFETDNGYFKFGDGTTAYKSLKYANKFPTTLAELTADATHRLVTDTEKSTWNSKQDKLTFDTTPTESSTNPVTSGGVKTALDAKANDSAISTIGKSGKLADATDDATHRLVTDTEKSTWNGKQDKLTFDTAPKASSGNPVTSGGVYTALAGKANTSDIIKASTGLSDSADLVRYADEIIINGGEL